MESIRQPRPSTALIIPYNMETDKILHLLAGYAVALTFGIFSPAAGAVAGILAAFGKEFVWDKWMKRGTFEWQDLNVTLVGVLVGFILAFVRSAV